MPTPHFAPNVVRHIWCGKSARSECLGRLFVFSEASLRRVLSSYVTYCALWRPSRSLGAEGSLRCNDIYFFPAIIDLGSVADTHKEGIRQPALLESDNERRRRARVGRAREAEGSADVDMPELPPGTHSCRRVAVERSG